MAHYGGPGFCLLASLLRTLGTPTQVPYSHPVYWMLNCPTISPPPFPPVHFPFSTSLSPHLPPVAGRLKEADPLLVPRLGLFGPTTHPSVRKWVVNVHVAQFESVGFHCVSGKGLDRFLGEFLAAADFLFLCLLLLTVLRPPA